MTDREKLVKLLASKPELLENLNIHIHRLYRLADHLIANGVTVRRWIPVTEWLPEVGKVVLVCGSRGGIYTAYLESEGRLPSWHKLNSKTHYCDPTHWMPLPEPPKEGE